MSNVHKSYFLELFSPNESRQHEFVAEAEESLRAQSKIESEDRLTFDEYLAQYFAG
jgi:primosomal protein N''